MAEELTKIREETAQYFKRCDENTVIYNLKQQNAALKALLREYVVKKRSGYNVCKECLMDWPKGEPEEHHKACRYIAAVGGSE